MRVEITKPPGIFANGILKGVLREIVHNIEAAAGEDGDLVMKLHDTIAETLGNTLKEALSIRFDAKLAASSLHFYDLRAIRAVRYEPPAGVSDIHFRSDLSGVVRIRAEVGLRPGRELGMDFDSTRFALQGAVGATQVTPACSQVLSKRR
jgi:hypothetical protein